MSEHDIHDHDHITLINEEGEEVLYEILFTFESDEFEKSYVLVFEAGHAEDEEVDNSLDILNKAINEIEEVAVEVEEEK